MVLAAAAACMALAAHAQTFPSKPVTLVVQSPAVIERARTSGMTIRYMPPQQLDATVRTDCSTGPK